MVVQRHNQQSSNIDSRYIWSKYCTLSPIEMMMIMKNATTFPKHLSSSSLLAFLTCLPASKVLLLPVKKLSCCQATSQSSSSFPYSACTRIMSAVSEWDKWYIFWQDLTLVGHCWCHCQCNSGAASSQNCSNQFQGIGIHHIYLRQELFTLWWATTSVERRWNELGEGHFGRSRANFGGTQLLQIGLKPQAGTSPNWFHLRSTLFQPFWTTETFKLPF